MQTKKKQKLKIKNKLEMINDNIRIKFIILLF